MAHYVVGDVQGCLEPLKRLLDHCRFDPARDLLIFAGDLVARGPDSLGTLRFVSRLGRAAVSVLGNHDLHLIALAHMAKRKTNKLDAVLDAPDAAELLRFLTHCPLAWHHSALNVLVVHAGMSPQWTIDTALVCAHEVETTLRDDRLREAFLSHMYGDEPACWDEDLRGHARTRFIINCLTRARFCTVAGHFEFRYKGAPGGQPEGYLPWFAVPGRQSLGTRLVFGHWSTLGTVAWPQWNAWCLDTGCVWGRELTALRLEDDRIFSVTART